MKLIALITLMGLSVVSFAQTTNLGNPIAWKNKLDSKTLIPVEIMPGYDQAAIDAEDIINDAAKDAPWRFGYKYQVNYTPENSGVWHDLPNGARLWQLGISCPNAMTINLLIENFDLPEGSHLYLYDVDRTNKVGAYTARNNREDGELGTELVHGDQIVVEYYEPANVSLPGTFSITNVVHGYRSLKTVQNQLWEKALNSSGDCNIDVNCPLGNGWEDQIRSVAMIVVNGSGICTGALINNTCDDGTPYFLTANHCLGGGTGNWAFRFNWESPPGTESCATTANSVDPGSPYDQTANGATTLVSGTQADHALLQIDNMTLTDAQNWNCFYAGWDNSDALTVTQATGIHHPSGDVKKICRENQSPYFSTAAGAQVWWIDDWDQGVTEPGSSGSPLFDQNGRIIGQLYGGAAACSGTNDNNQYDYYGRLGVSWGLGIGNYLAPTSCGSAATDDGWDPNQPTLTDDAGISAVISPTGQICATDFDPEVTLRNFGSNALTSVTINYDIDAGPNNTFNWTGNLASGATVNVTLPTMTTTTGAHVLNASTSLPNGMADMNSSNDASSSNFDISTGEPVSLEINTDCWGEEIYWQIEDGLSTVVASGGNALVPPGGQQISDDADPGAYGDEVLVTVNLCLTPDCYTFTIFDDYGDGLYGSQYGSCTVDGDYTITEVNTSTVMATIQATNSDYGNSEVANFCMTPPCTGTLNSSTVEELCFGDDDGSITVSVTGGTAPFTYDIGSGPQGSGTFTNLTPGSYTVTVIDGSACSSAINVNLNGPAELTATSVGIDETCPGVNDGQINVTANGGTGTLQYDIGSGQQGSPNFTGLNTNTYNVTVTDANGCTVSNNGIVIASGSGVNATMNVTDISCNGLTDGQIQVIPSNGTAPYTYDIGSGAQGGDTFTGLSSGNYTVDITDNNGCTGQVMGTVNEPTAISGTYSTTDDTGSNNGSIDLTPSGGTPPYTFSWTGPNSFASTTEDPNNLEGGTYAVTVTDANGCTHDITGIEVISTIGIGEHQIDFVIYPNPSNGLFNVQLSSSDENANYEILDVTGRLIFTGQISGEMNFQVDLTDKADGTYFFRLNSGGIQSTMPIINQK